MWYEGNPCNMHLLDLAAEVKRGVQEAGMVGFRFNTVGVSDAISMGTPGMGYSLQSRDLIADSVETVMGAQVRGGGMDRHACGMRFFLHLPHIASTKCMWGLAAVLHPCGVCRLLAWISILACAECLSGGWHSLGGYTVPTSPAACSGTTPTSPCRAATRTCRGR